MFRFISKYIRDTEKPVLFHGSPNDDNGQLSCILAILFFVENAPVRSGNFSLGRSISTCIWILHVHCGCMHIVWSRSWQRPIVCTCGGPILSNKTAQLAYKRPPPLVLRSTVWCRKGRLIFAKRR